MAMIGCRILKGLCPECLPSFQHLSQTINLCRGTPKYNGLFFLQIAISAMKLLSFFVVNGLNPGVSVKLIDWSIKLT